MPTTETCPTCSACGARYPLAGDLPQFGCTACKNPFDKSSGYAKKSYRVFGREWRRWGKK